MLGPVAIFAELAEDLALHPTFARDTSPLLFVRICLLILLPVQSGLS